MLGINFDPDKRDGLIELLSFLLLAAFAFWLVKTFHPVTQIPIESGMVSTYLATCSGGNTSLVTLLLVFILLLPLMFLMWAIAQAVKKLD